MSRIAHSQFIAGTEGVFSIPDEVYHNHVAAPEVNRGIVVRLIKETPAHVQAMLTGASPKKETRAMIVGRLMDHALLEPDRFKIGSSHWVYPEGMDMRTKDGLAWKKDHPDLPAMPQRTDSANIVSAEDIDGMIMAVLSNPLARRIIEESTKQESAFCHDPDTGLLRKCRPDARLVDNHDRLLLADLKTTFIGGASALAWSSHCARLGYHIQDSWYSDIYAHLIGENPYFLFLVVERKPPYAVRIFQIDEEGKRVAREKYKRALELYRSCKENNSWPAYPPAIEVIRLPNWELQPSDPIIAE